MSIATRAVTSRLGDEEVEVVPVPEVGVEGVVPAVGEPIA